MGRVKGGNKTSLYFRVRVHEQLFKAQAWQKTKVSLRNITTFAFAANPLRKFRKLKSSKSRSSYRILPRKG